MVSELMKIARRKDEFFPEKAGQTSQTVYRKPNRVSFDKN